MIKSRPVTLEITKITKAINDMVQGRSLKTLIKTMNSVCTLILQIPPNIWRNFLILQMWQLTAQFDCWNRFQPGNWAVAKEKSSPGWHHHSVQNGIKFASGERLRDLDYADSLVCLPVRIYGTWSGCSRRTLEGYNVISHVFCIFRI